MQAHLFWSTNIPPRLWKPNTHPIQRKGLRLIGRLIDRLTAMKIDVEELR